MTGRPAIIGEDISEETVCRLVEELAKRFDALDLILYDVTAKPPATVEWE
jgi:GMP synthase PP-ATPase subunit